MDCIQYGEHLNNIKYTLEDMYLNKFPESRLMWGDLIPV